MDGKVAIVTGAARGLGAEYATILAQEGATVLVTDVLEEQGRGVAERIGGSFHPLDVRREKDWIALCREAETRHGGVDVLVNNAGIARMEHVLAESLEGWEAVVAVNQTGPFLGMKHCIPLMVKRGGGSVINIASVFGLVGGPNLAAYHAAKSALFGLTRNVAVMVARDNVRVNTICPGPVLTEMAEEEERQVPGTIANVLSITPMGRAASTRELASAVLFLASDESSYVTGTDLIVDGGLRAGYQFRPPGSFGSP